MVTDEQRMLVEFEMYKDNLAKIEKTIDEIKILTNRYLEGFNRVLEAQSENRACDKQMYQDLNALKEKLVTMDMASSQLQTIDAYTEIKRFIEHAKNEKEILDFITTTREFITSTQTSLKVLNGTAVALATCFLGMLFAFLSKMFGG